MELNTVSIGEKTATVLLLQERVDEAVKTLLDLKTKYKTLTGEEYKPVAAAGATGGEDKNRKERENKSEKQGGGGGAKKGKGDKSNQGKEASGGAGGAGSGEGQGPKKQTRWETGNGWQEGGEEVEPDGCEFKSLLASIWWLVLLWYQLKWSLSLQ